MGPLRFCHVLVYRTIGHMSLTPEIFASPFGIPDRGLLAINGISLRRPADEGCPNCSCQTFWENERVCRWWRVEHDDPWSAVLVSLTVAANPQPSESVVP